MTGREFMNGLGSEAAANWRLPNGSVSLLLVSWEPMRIWVRVPHTYHNLGILQPRGPLSGPSPKQLGLREPLRLPRGDGRGLALLFGYFPTLERLVASASEGCSSPVCPAPTCPTSSPWEAEEGSSRSPDSSSVKGTLLP